MAFLASLVCARGAEASPILGFFEGWISSSIDNLGSVFGVHGSDKQLNWRVTGSFVYESAPLGVTDQSALPDSGGWWDSTRNAEWVTMSLTFYDLNGVNRGTFTPQSSSSYAPPLSVGLDTVIIDDYQEGPFNDFSDDPAELFIISDGFQAPRLQPLPNPLIYREEMISVSMNGSHFHQDFITAFAYDRALWTFGHPTGSYSFVNKIADEQRVTDYEYRIEGDFVIDSLTVMQAPVAVPEPTSLVLLGTGVAGLLSRRRTKRRSNH
jgi:hypothetical protein